jgi:hypothetical protein
MGEGRDIARPATFICDRGVVVWRDLTDNWRVRPRPRDILDALGRTQRRTHDRTPEEPAR